MKGIDKEGVSFYKNRNAIIYFEYKYAKEVTMEQLAEKYSITKQRIWQIIRRCQLGEGDYYEGFENFKEKEDSLKASSFSSNIAQVNLIASPRPFLQPLQAAPISSLDI